MAGEEVGDRSLSRAEAESLQRTLELDLVAFYKVAEEAAVEILAKGVRRGLSPDELLAELDTLFEEPLEGQGG